MIDLHLLHLFIHIIHTVSLITCIHIWRRSDSHPFHLLLTDRPQRRSSFPCLLITPITSACFCSCDSYTDLISHLPHVLVPKITPSIPAIDKEWSTPKEHDRASGQKRPQTMTRKARTNSRAQRWNIPTQNQTTTAGRQKARGRTKPQ